MCWDRLIEAETSARKKIESPRSAAVKSEKGIASTAPRPRRTNVPAEVVVLAQALS